MANIKDLSKSAEKWQRRAAVAGEDYKAGVENPRTPWAKASTDAAANYTAGVTAAAQQGRFAAGVAKAGDAAYRQGALEKGPGRYVEGVSLAGNRWQDGFKPYGDLIRSTQLPPRGPKGSPANLQRVAVIAQGMRKLKESSGSK